MDTPEVARTPARDTTYNLSELNTEILLIFKSREAVFLAVATLLLLWSLVGDGDTSGDIRRAIQILY